MLSKVTDSEANKKTKADTASGKLTEATSMIVSYEERGEGELEVDTLVSTTISTAGGPASPSREWPCSSITCAAVALMKTCGADKTGAPQVVGQKPRERS